MAVREGVEPSCRASATISFPTSANGPLWDLTGDGGGGWIRTSVHGVKVRCLRPLDYTPTRRC